jgi:hypothetical protein
MDFYQPHLYPADVLISARRVIRPSGAPARPVFYGEEGDDHLDVSDEVKESGRAVVPAVWAGLFGEAGLPAQPWLGAKLLEQGRAAELGAVAHFIGGSGFARQTDLRPFSAVVEGGDRGPLALTGTLVWQRRPAPDIAVPLDGRMPVEFADVPRFYSAPEGNDGFPTQGTYHIDVPVRTTFTARVSKVGEGEPKLELLLDGAVVAHREWAGDARRPSASSPDEIRFPVPAGRHTLVVRNAGQRAWIEIPAIDLGTEVSRLAAVGQRGAGFVAVWLWNRTDVYAAQPRVSTGTLVLDDVPKGTWHVTWWNTLTGQSGATEVRTHGGGALRLPTPPIARHAAVVLTR